MKKSIIFILLILFVILFLFFISIKLSAQDQTSDAKTIYAILKKIGATDEQIKKIMEIYLESMQKIRLLRIQLQRLTLDFEEEYIKENPDENKIIETLEKIAQCELEIKKIQLKSEFEIRKILGYDLFMKFKALWEQAKRKS